MNEIMKVLTIISTIFIPLTFIVGVYGMNFNTERSKWNMPELNWPLGYPLVMGFMALVALGMVIYFWRKGWLRRSPVPRDKDRS
jgi:magnesium transporter